MGMDMTSKTTTQCQSCTGTQIQNMLASYRACRRNLGVESADKQWMSEPIAHWCYNLLTNEEGYKVLNQSTRMVLAMGMSETLALRDAIIVSLLCPKKTLTQASIVCLSYQPHSKNSIKTMYQAIDAAFTDSTTRPDQTRCTVGMRMLTEIIDCVPKSYREQPFAIAAYIHWWLGDCEGVRYANQALAINEECTLASIIKFAFIHEVQPAWTMHSPKSC